MLVKTSEKFCKYFRQTFPRFVNIEKAKAKDCNTSCLSKGISVIRGILEMRDYHTIVTLISNLHEKTIVVFWASNCFEETSQSFFH